MAPKLLVFGPGYEHRDKRSKRHGHRRQDDENRQHRERVEIAIFGDGSGYCLHFTSMIAYAKSASAVD